MTCPICGSQITRYFHYSRATTKEQGQFQYRIFDDTILLDYHVFESGESRPADKNYDTEVLGDVTDLRDLHDFFCNFPFYMEKRSGSGKISYEESTKTGAFKPRFGGIILRFTKAKPFDRIVFQDSSETKLFSIPISVFENECRNALIDMLTGVEKVRQWAPKGQR